MRIFDRFKKNKAERLEDNFQVRHIFSPDFNLENNKEIEKLLDTIAFLYRDIRGRRENLAPLFVVGGVYDIKNPIFENLYLGIPWTEIDYLMALNTSVPLFKQRN